MSSDSESSDNVGEKIRLSLRLAKDYKDRSLEVPSEPIAVPADIGRRGLSAVINHLLDRKVEARDEDRSDDDESVDEDESDSRLPAIPFEFIVGSNSTLLRTGVEREARRSGLSLEEAIPITYFPAQEAPEASGESDPLPDWISALRFLPDAHSTLCSASYDGAISFFRLTEKGVHTSLTKVNTISSVHNGPIKCMDAAVRQSSMWVATGSMDHTLSVCQISVGQKNISSTIQQTTKCEEGHTSAPSSLDLFLTENVKLMASTDWDGGLCLWDLAQSTDQGENSENEPSKKKNRLGKSAADTHTVTLAPSVSIQAHTSHISGVSWGNMAKPNESDEGTVSRPKTLVTGSWDHSLKVWDVDRQECVLTLNGSRVVSCLDTSYHSAGIVATGHPDCTIRLWDVRTTDKSSGAIKVSDRTLRPSHKAWVSAVQWSQRNPYQLSSTSHDGTVKLWDIRSSIPLHSVRAFGKEEKGMCLAFGGNATGDTQLMFAGGTDCTIKQFRMNSTASALSH